MELLPLHRLSLPLRRRPRGARRLGGYDVIVCDIDEAACDLAREEMIESKWGMKVSSILLRSAQPWLSRAARRPRS